MLLWHVELLHSELLLCAQKCLCMAGCECLRFIAKKENPCCFQAAVSRWHSCKPARGKRVIDQKFWLDRYRRWWTFKCVCVCQFQRLNFSYFIVSLWTSCRRSQCYFELCVCVRVCASLVDPSACAVKLLHTLTSQSAPVLSCSFSSDGELVVSG